MIILSGTMHVEKWKKKGLGSTLYLTAPMAFESVGIHSKYTFKTRFSEVAPRHNKEGCAIKSYSTYAVLWSGV